MGVPQKHQQCSCGARLESERRVIDLEVITLPSVRDACFLCADLVWELFPFLIDSMFNIHIGCSQWAELSTDI